MIQEDYCEMCNDEIETIDHLFFDCLLFTLVLH